MRYKRDKPPQCSHPGACTAVLTPPAWSCSFPALSRVNREKRTRETRNMNLSTILRTAINVVEKVIVMIVDLIRDELENKDREEITQNLKSKMGKAFENHKKKMEALPEYFQEKKESTQNRVQNLIKQLEKNKEMKKEKERAQALQSRLKRKVLHFFKRIHTLKEDVQKWPETIMLELRVQRGALKNIKGMEEKDIIFALENMLEKNLQEFSQNIETLKEDVEKCMEFIKSELQVLEDELEEKKQGKKEEEIELDQKKLLKKNMRQFSQKIETLKEDVAGSVETINLKLRNLINELEEEGQEMKKAKERAQALQSRLNRKDQQLSRRIQTLKEDVEELPEIIMLELQVRRGALKNIKGMMKEDVALALEALKKNCQEFSQKIETLEKEVGECMETINRELLILKDELEVKKQGRKEEEIELDQKKLLKYNMRQFSQKIETLKEDVAGSVETINLKLRNLINELEEEGQGMKKEKELAWFLESRLKRKVQHFSRRIQTLQEDVEELPEIIMLELQVRRRVLKNMKGKKENDIASALETLKKKNMREFSQKIETLKEDAEECMATINHELQILINELVEEGQGKEQSWECCTETEVEELSARIQAMLLWKTASL